MISSQEIAACKEWMFIIADPVCSNKWRRKKGSVRNGVEDHLNAVFVVSRSAWPGQNIGEK